jgi:hypothetical protein
MIGGRVLDITASCALNNPNGLIDLNDLASQGAVANFNEHRTESAG